MHTLTSQITCYTLITVIHPACHLPLCKGRRLQFQHQDEAVELPNPTPAAMRRDEAADLPSPRAAFPNGQLGEGLTVNTLSEQLFRAPLIGGTTSSARVPHLQLAGYPLHEGVSDQVASPSHQPQQTSYAASAENIGLYYTSHGGSSSHPWLYPANVQPSCVMANSAQQGADGDGQPSAHAIRDVNIALPSWCLELFEYWGGQDATNQQQSTHQQPLSATYEQGLSSRAGPL